MDKLLVKMQEQGYPLTTISKHTGVSYSKLYRCIKGMPLRTDDAEKVQQYANKLEVSL